MEARHAREIAEAFALLSGDMRDWPLRCAWCDSEDVELDHARDVLGCRSCRKMTTCRVAEEERHARAAAHVAGGVGGPLVAWAEARDA